MAGHMTYEESKKFVFRGLFLLAAVTLVEVFFSLIGKGLLGFSFMADIEWVVYPIGVILIALSLYKAYFIVFDFMHLRQEVKSMSLTILMPMGLLVWAVIAFFQEGDFWGERRAKIQDFNQRTERQVIPVSPAEQQGNLNIEPVGDVNPTEEGVGAYEVDQ